MALIIFYFKYISRIFIPGWEFQMVNSPGGGTFIQHLTGVGTNFRRRMDTNSHRDGHIISWSLKYTKFLTEGGWLEKGLKISPGHMIKNLGWAFYRVIFPGWCSNQDFCRIPTVVFTRECFVDLFFAVECTYTLPHIIRTQKTCTIYHHLQSDLNT